MLCWAFTLCPDKLSSITSILVCRFMLSLRQFESAISSVTISMPGSRTQEHMASMMLEFGAQPSDSLPGFIASFAHPVHTDLALSDMELNEIDEDLDVSQQREADVVAQPSPNQGLAPGEASTLKYSG